MIKFKKGDVVIYKPFPSESVGKLDRHIYFYNNGTMPVSSWIVDMGNDRSVVIATAELRKLSALEQLATAAE